MGHGRTAVRPSFADGLLGMTEHRIRNADAPLSLSIVIPTHNRRESLGRTLTALSGQTVPVSDFEVVVVADGCHDGTTTFVRELSLGFELQVFELPGLGAAAARNRGAAATRGEILVFLDDDIEPFPSLLASYLDEHARAPGRLLIGRTQPVLEPKTFYEAELRRWWFDHILTMRRRSHRFGYRDLHAGNFSIASRVFASVKGFDESFPGCGGEDYELGMRLLAAGVDFSYCHQAGGYHYDDTNLERSLLRAFQEGRADVLTAQKHPELIPGLRLHGIVVGQNPIAHLANRLGLDRLQALWLKHWTGLLDRAHLRRRAVNSYVRLRASCYRRGVEAQLGSMNRLQQLPASYSRELTQHPGIADVDLRHGLVTARRQLDTQRPNGARLRFGAVKIATIPATPGMEPLRACHLEEALKASPSCSLRLRSRLRNRRGSCRSGLSGQIRTTHVHRCCSPPNRLRQTEITWVSTARNRATPAAVLSANSTSLSPSRISRCLHRRRSSDCLFAARVDRSAGSRYKPRARLRSTPNISAPRSSVKSAGS